MKPDISRWGLLRVWTVMLLVGMAHPWLAWAAPLNDLCSGALVIPGSGPFPYRTPAVDIAGATLNGDPPAPACPSFSPMSSRSTWYRFSPSITRNYLLTVCADAPTATTVGDTILAVYTSANACAGPFAPIADGCNDDACGPTGFQSSLSTRLQAGTTYYIVVWQFDDTVPPPGGSTLQLLVSPLVVPENDRCEAAVPVALNRTISGTTVGATNHYELNDTECFVGLGQTPVSASGRDVVYAFRAPATNRYSFRLYNYAGLGDVVLYVAGQCPSAPFPAVVTSCLGAANRSSVNTAEAVVCLDLIEDQTVYIFVDEEGNSNGAGFLFQVTTCQPEYEGNNTALAANGMNAEVTGAIQPQGDVDYFCLGAPPQGSRVFALVDAESAPTPNLDLRVVTTMATLEYDADNNDTVFGDSSANVAGTPLSGEPSFLRVNYAGFVSASPYWLYAVVQPPMAEAIVEGEPNNSLATASQAENNYFYGALAEPSPSADVDLFRFEASAGDLIFLSLDGDPGRDGTALNARLELLDPAGNVVLSVNDDAAESVTNNVPGDTAAFRPDYPGEGLVYRAASNGVYYARLNAGANEADPSNAGDYLLSITKNGIRGSSGTNHWPVLSDLTASSPVLTGTVATLTGQISDWDLGQVQRVTVDWGDGTDPTVLGWCSAGSGFSTNHVYEQPGLGATRLYTIRVTTQDSFGSQATATVPIQVLPALPARFLSIAAPNGQPVQLQLEGTPGGIYDLWGSQNLTDWFPVGSATAAQDSTFTFQDSAQPRPPRRFYRALVR